MIKVVIVDDEPAIFDVLTDMLHKIDPQIVVSGVATSKKDAFRIITNTNPDALFLDINLPLGSGLDILDMFPARHFRVIFISAYSVLEPLTKKYPHLGFVAKPIDEDDLEKMIAILKDDLSKEAN